MRPLAVAVIALALAGCGPGRSATRQPGDLPPVALRQTAPLARQINGGLIPKPFGPERTPTPQPSLFVESGPEPERLAPTAPSGLNPPVVDASVQAASLSEPIGAIEAFPPPIDPAPPAFEAEAEAVTAGPDPASDPPPRRLGTPIMVDAARVNETVITVRELRRVVADRVGGIEKLLELPGPVQNQIARAALDSLIDHVLLAQAARKKMDKPEKWDAFKQYIEKKWQDEELPRLMELEEVDNEIDLDKKLEARGDGVRDAHDAFLLETTSREFAGLILRDRIERAEPKEIYKYYTDNIDKFQRPAQITWREIFVPSGPESSATIEDARARLARGEEFAAVAHALSKGPKASQGGLWVTTPDAFAVASVREALAQLPIGTVSAPIAVEDGTYLVQVDARREAGPRPYGEVQKEIDEALLESRFIGELEGLLAEMRRSAAISSPLFEGTGSAPSTATEADHARGLE